MRTLRSWLSRLGAAVSGRRLDPELDDELSAHLQMHIDDNRRRGMSPDEARRDALVSLGGLTQVKEAYRERRGLPFLETAGQDLRFALRVLRKSPGFAAVVLLTLAVGIGVNSVMFSVVNTVLLRPLPYRAAQQLMSVQTVDTARRPHPTSPPDFYDYRTRNRTLDGLEAYYTGPFNLSGATSPERVPALIVSGTFFDTLGIQPILGRAFATADERWGDHRVAILSAALWNRRFGGDPALIGQPITLNGDAYVVAGVMPDSFSFLGINAQLFVPMSFEPGDNLNSHSNNFLRMFGRVKPDVTRQQAADDLTSISNAIIAAQSVNQGTSIDVVPLRDVLVGSDVRSALLVMLGAVGFVLLISCGNLANLLLARAAVRQREIAVRLALGAPRARLMRQFFTESLLLAVTGGALGLAVAYACQDALNVVSQSVLPRAMPIRVDPVVLMFTFAVATGTGLLLGLAPAAHVRGDVRQRLMEGARSTDSSARNRVRAGLVIAEVALSLVLLIGAGLLVKSMYRLLRVDRGFDANSVLTLQVNLAPGKVRGQTERTRVLS